MSINKEGDHNGNRSHSCIVYFVIRNAVEEGINRSKLVVGNDREKYVIDVKDGDINTTPIGF